MKGCDTWGNFKHGDSTTLTLSGSNKFWVVPDGCTQAEGCYPCNLDCLGCFYISANVADNGVLVAGIGYGHNTQVQVHNGISTAVFQATDQTGKSDSVSCTTTSCAVSHIIQAQAGSASFTIDGPTATSATLVFTNTASNAVTLMRGCENWGNFKQGDATTLKLSGSNKFWVVPDGCTQAEGCYPCNLDCLGCFYISANVADNGVLVAGIGYGHNTPVQVHNGVGIASFKAIDQTGQADMVDCSLDSCDVNHIIQAQPGSATFVVGGLAVESPQATVVI